MHLASAKDDYKARALLQVPQTPRIMPYTGAHYLKGTGRFGDVCLELCVIAV